MKDRYNSSRRGNGPTFLALIALVAAAVGLLGLVALVLPQAVGLVLVVGGFFFLFVFHYLLWGWWMPTDSLDREDSGEEEPFSSHPRETIRYQSDESFDEF